ncbi:MAG: hypothetical protein AAGJ79_15255, partial [Verrucomicrobiota bacterium]
EYMTRTLRRPLFFRGESLPLKKLGVSWAVPISDFSSIATDAIPSNSSDFSGDLGGLLAG